MYKKHKVEGDILFYHMELTCKYNTYTNRKNLEANFFNCAVYFIIKQKVSSVYSNSKCKEYIRKEKGTNKYSYIAPVVLIVYSI
jgi:hypothetical protein